MELLVVLRAIKEVLESVIDVYNAYQIINSFFNNPDDVNRQRYEEEMQAIATTRDELLSASETILVAVTQLGNQVFKTTMSDKLGDVDAAAQDLDYARRHGMDPNAVALALDRSANALADLQRLADSKAYPVEALLLTITEVLAQRMMILREADPRFAVTPTGRTPIEAAISLIRGAASSIEQAILAANVVHQSFSTTKRRVRVSQEDGGGFEWVITTTFTVRYVNVSGTASSSGSVSTEEGIDDPAFLAGKQALLDSANAARERGLTDDLANAGIAQFRGIADEAERALHASEMLPIIKIIFNRPPTYVELGQYLAARQKMPAKQALVSVIDRLSSDRDYRAIEPQNLSTVAELMQFPNLTELQAGAMRSIGDVLGAKRMVLALLNGRA